MPTDRTRGLRAAVAHAERYLAGLDERPVRAHGVPDAGGPLPEHGEDPEAVVEALVAAAQDGIVASSGPRYFGFVTGGSLPAAIAADWLLSAWDQNAGLEAMSPAAAAIEAAAAGWVLDLLGLAPTASVGFVTGAQSANTTCLAAARHAVLARAGWDVGRDGLSGAPPVTVVCGEEGHSTVFAALRLLGFGEAAAIRVPADDQGRMRADALPDLDETTIVCAQAGNVNSGSFDPFDALADACAERGAWLHVDGAFGLWASAAPSTRHLTAGAERADSWAVDAHKWLNVPYDGAMAIVADPAAHRAAMALSAAYLVAGGRDGSDYVPEASRRARGVPVWAALRQLGRSGVTALVERNCAQARRMAGRLTDAGFEVLNDVVLNQVVVAFGDDDRTRAVIDGVQREGTCWLAGTTWRGRAAMRIAFSNWSTTDEDVDRSAAAIARAATAPR